jgi:hypothetical protein
MTNHPMDDTLVRARTLVIDLERHIDRAAAERDLAEVGRAWVRATQLERALRGLLPESAISGLDVPDAQIG